MNLKKGTIYNTPLNPLSRGELQRKSSLKMGVFSRGELYQINVDMSQIILYE
jgi:hypothetical protein